MENRENKIKERAEELRELSREKERRKSIEEFLSHLKDIKNLLSVSPEDKTSDIVEAINSIKIEPPEKPESVKNDLQAILKAIPKQTTNEDVIDALKGVEEAIKALPEVKIEKTDIDPIIEAMEVLRQQIALIPQVEFPELEFKDGRLKVSVDKVGGGGGLTQIETESLLGIEENQTNGEHKTQLVDADGNSAEVDDSSKALVQITAEHHKIHAGYHFCISDVVDLALGNVLDIQFTTPNSEARTHLVFAIDCESETSLFLYEGATVNTVGTPVVPINNNRNIARESVNTVAQITNGSIADANADTATALATEISHRKVGAGNKSLSSEGRDSELILKANTTYCLRFIADTAGYVDYDLSWYEQI